MNAIVAIAAILAGIGIFLTARYLASETLHLNRADRATHGLTFALVLAVAAAQIEGKPELARLLAVLLLFAAGRSLLVAPRRHWIVPLVAMLFALSAMIGYVALD